ncbi:hypothetical protein CHL76_09495 [Marinococcus halophilus]|uniref:ATPase dynein-related AAA domain-containing protein n=1 Tax=Marinococcus halophilus TaxID=1371 RepID=A0A510Y4B6_MARHA|nr:AAA family ATPase [Marinococcus halophilus]OZT79930.1 hypothetical protein CHL76_09495 [Marinococcus halophilus]GEK58154.1 hypothetical protein MHA01_10590 [Marinococcus halophilus]
MTDIVERKELNLKEKNRIEKSYIVGKLAEDSLNLPRLGRDPGKAVTIQGNYGRESIIFYIKPLSKEPQILQTHLGKPSTEVYIGFDNKNMRYLERYGYTQQEDSVNFLRNHFKNRLILFKPFLSYDRARDKYHYNLEIVLDEKIDEEVASSKHYVAIPNYTHYSYQMFESRLMSGNPIELTNYNHTMDIPEFITCGEYLYLIQDENVFRKYEMNDNLYICENPEGIRRIEKPSSFESYLRLGQKGINFAPVEEKNKWVDECNDRGETVPMVMKYRNAKNKKAVEKEENKNEVNFNIFKSDDNSDISESDFMKRLDYLARSKKLRYSVDDLYNFHTSVKTSNFTILGGMSGTGKTELARLYAEALKMEEGDNLLFIPVKPSFTEPSDLLGFLNQQTGVYHESEIGLASFLYKASQNPNKMHMVLFDEMNLGQVEHYFSDFISILEFQNEKRLLRLFNQNVNCVQLHFANGIEIGSNVLFIGTANFDETTRDFSNRMLDRSNVIILDKLSFLEAKKYEEEKVDTVEDYEEKEKTEIRSPNVPITTANFVSWIEKNISIAALEDDELSILDKLHDEISNYDSQTGVSFRIVNQIASYLQNVPKNEEDVPFIDRKDAFDYQIKQRILSKVRGHQDQIEDLVGIYQEDYQPGRIRMILSENESLKCEKSIEYLKQKAKELTQNGYTL